MFSARKSEIYSRHVLLIIAVEFEDTIHKGFHIATTIKDIINILTLVNSQLVYARCIFNRAPYSSLHGIYQMCDL